MAPSRGSSSALSVIHQPIQPPPTISSSDPIRSCGESALALLPTRPNAAIRLAHNKLHAFPWRHVPLCWRRLFEEGCMWEIWNLIPKEEEHASATRADYDPGFEEIPSDTVTLLADRAIIISGAPLRREWFDRVLDRLQHLLYGYKSANEIEDNSDGRISSPRPFKRPRVEQNSASAEISNLSIPSTFPSRPAASPFPKVTRSISVQSKPLSYTDFTTHISSPSPTPLILQNIITHWPALHRWRNPQYWDRITLGGRRVVPIELGRSYTDEGWGQKLVTFDSFLRGALLSPSRGNGETDETTQPDAESTRMRTGYLAQHDLFTQIPALRNDIAIPDYCYISPETNARVHADDYNEDEDENGADPQEPLMNIWLGPANTVSPCHTDPHHNILAQVFGRKYVRLYAPTEDAKLYPMGGEKGASNSEDESGAVDMANTSRLDVGLAVEWDGVSDAETQEQAQKAREQDAEFPRFQSAEYVEAAIEAGECLFIPRGWWHYVTSLDVSCSVSFWWD